MSYNYQDNDEELIEAAGETIFENIYHDCRHEIKDLIITKLLSKIEDQVKTINTLEKENKKIRDNFLYVLKRILSNKEEYSINNNNFSNLVISNYYSNKIKPYESGKNVSYRINKSNSKEKKISIDKSSRNIKFKLDFNSSFDNISGEDNNNSDDERNNNIIEAKAKKYLNDLYKKNFNGTDGIPNSNFINKNISLYEELFSKPANRNYIYKDTGLDDNYSPKKKGGISSSKRKKSTGMRKQDYMESFIDDKLVKTLNDNDFTTERSLLGNDNKNKKHNRSNMTHHYYKPKKIMKYTLNNESDKKNKKKAISFVKRSPYLLNKF